MNGFARVLRTARSPMLTALVTLAHSAEPTVTIADAGRRATAE
ncbi:hypothetical protein [Halegenticoccus soli]|nr:hypothetical protein [Halegenticoccus soli]